jgi:hypothetical protein
MDIGFQFMVPSVSTYGVANFIPSEPETANGCLVLPRAGTDAERHACELRILASPGCRTLLCGTLLCDTNMCYEESF